MTFTTPTITDIKTNATALLRADWAPALERFCRGLAIAIAAAYTAGWLLGTWVHMSSSLLGRMAAELAEPDWHQARLQQLKARLAVRETPTHAPQPSLPLIDAPQLNTTADQPVVARAKRASKVPATPKPSRHRRAKGSSHTTAPAAA